MPKVWGHPRPPCLCRTPPGATWASLGNVRQAERDASAKAGAALGCWWLTVQAADPPHNGRLAAPVAPVVSIVRGRWICPEIQQQAARLPEPSGPGRSVSACGVPAAIACRLIPLDLHPTKKAGLEELGIPAAG